MKRWKICASAGAAISIAMLVPSSHLVVPASAAQQVLPLQACAEEQHALSVLFLVDTSASLKDSSKSKGSDPTNQRVTALQLALSALSSQRKAEKERGSEFSIYVDFLSFGTTTSRTFGPQEWPEWGELPDDPRLLLSSMAKFKTANTASDTDYVAALRPYPEGRPPDAPQVGALDFLKQAPDDSCRLLVWFTDGQFDFDPPKGGGAGKTLTWWDGGRIRNEQDVARAKKDGFARLCEPDGLADQLRSGDIRSGEGAQVAVVALGERTPDFELIGAIAEGAGCGAKPARGALYRAQDVKDLIFGLQQAVVGKGNGPANDHLNTCVGAACDVVDPAKMESFDYPFTLTAGVSSFNLVALEGDEHISSVLISPSGEKVPLDAVSGEATMSDGTQLHVEPFEASPAVHLLRARLGADPNKWAGQWRVRFIATDPAAGSKVNRAALYVFAGDLSVHLRNPKDVLRRGREGTVVLELVTDQGRLVTRPEFMPEPDLQLSIAGKQIPVGKIHPDGTWEIRYQVPQDFDGASVSLHAELIAKLQIDPSLPVVELNRWSIDDLPAVPVKDLPKYPLLDDPIAAFDRSIDQHHTVVSSSLLVESAGQESAGCVTLSEVSSPTNDDASLPGVVRVLDGGTEVEVGADCAIHLDSGEKRTLTVELSVPKEKVLVNTSLQGSLRFSSVSDVDPTQSDEFTKELAAAVVPTFTRQIDWQRVILMTVLAALLALSVLYGLNFLGAKLEVGQAAFVSIPVRYRPGVLERVDGDVPTLFRVRDEDLDVIGMPLPGRYRGVSFGGISFSSHVSRSPFSDVSGRARAANCDVVIANDGTDRSGDSGITPVSLGNVWVFRADAKPTKRGDSFEEVRGVMTMVLPANPDAARSAVAERLRAVHDQLSDACSRLAVAPISDEERPAQGDEQAAASSEDPFESVQKQSATPIADGDLLGSQEDPLGTVRITEDPLGGGLIFDASPDTGGPLEAQQKRKWGRRRNDNPDDHSGGSAPEAPPPPF